MSQPLELPSCSFISQSLKFWGHNQRTTAALWPKPSRKNNACVIELIEVCTGQPGNVTAPARFLQTSCRRRRTTQRRGRSLDATVALGSRPAPNVIQPARSHQAASSRATLAGGAARAAKLGIFTTAPLAQSHSAACATRHAVARLSPSRGTSVARQRGTCLPDEWLLNGEGRGTTRLIAAAGAAEVSLTPVFLNTSDF